MREIYRKLGFEDDAIGEIIAVARTHYQRTIAQKITTPKQLESEFEDLQKACRRVLTLLGGLPDSVQQAINSPTFPTAENLADLVLSERYTDPLGKLRMAAETIAEMGFSAAIYDGRTGEAPFTVEALRPEMRAKDGFVKYAASIFERQTGNRAAINTWPAISQNPDQPSRDFSRFLETLAQDAGIPVAGLEDRFGRLRKCKAL